MPVLVDSDRKKQDGESSRFGRCYWLDVATADRPIEPVKFKTDLESIRLSMGQPYADVEPINHRLQSRSWRCSLAIRNGPRTRR